MKYKKILTTTIIASLSLPLGAFAQANGSSGMSNDRDEDRQQNESRWETSQNERSSQWGTSSNDTQKMKKVKEKSLEDQTTADHLIGKKVVDREGNEIGEIKDIGLSQVVDRSDQSDDRKENQKDRNSDSPNNEWNDSNQRTGDMAATGQSGNNSDRAQSERDRYSTESNRNQTGDTDTARMGDRSGNGSTEFGMSQDSEQNEVRVYISTGDDELLQVSASQLTYDKEKDELSIDVSQSEIDSLPEAGDEIAARR